VQEAAVIGVPHLKWDERPFGGGGVEAGADGDRRYFARVSRAAICLVLVARRGEIRRCDSENLDGQDAQGYTTRTIPKPVYPISEVAMNMPVEQQIELRIDIVSDVV
jgi:hypothetical protein